MSRNLAKQKNNNSKKNDVNEFLISYFFPNIILGIIAVLVLIYKFCTE